MQANAVNNLLLFYKLPVSRGPSLGDDVPRGWSIFSLLSSSWLTILTFMLPFLSV